MRMIRVLRDRMGIDQKTLASAVGVSQPTVSDWEKGRKSPSPENIGRLAAFFDVSTDLLFERASVPDKSSGGVRIPVLGRVAAGLPIEACEDILDYEEISPELASRGEYFALRLRGDSMEPRMTSGDVVIVRRQPEVENGEIAIVLVGQAEATCKRIFRHEHGISLISNNPRYEPMVYSDRETRELPVTVLGKVVELRAKF